MEIILALLAVIFLVIVLLLLAKADETEDGAASDKGPLPPEQKLAGISGEKTARKIIESVLRDDDHLFSNVRIEYENKPAELDAVVVNKYGVFIFEVKNYTGQLVGKEDDFEWQKYKTTAAGNTYEKVVKNPIRQVKRQVYILARFLDYYGQRVWVKGYVILLHGSSPVDSPYLLNSAVEIDRAIHSGERKPLHKNTVEKIVQLLS